MKTAYRLLCLSCLVFISFAEECFDVDKVMKEYEAHKTECEKLSNKDDHDEMMGCILGRYETTNADGKVDLEKFREKAESYITKSENKKKIIDEEIIKCEKSDPDLKSKFFHCVGEAFKRECFLPKVQK